MTTQAQYGSQVPRAAVPSTYKWHIEDIYTNQEQWEADCRHLEELCHTLQSYQGTLKEQSGLLRALKLRDKLEAWSSKIYAYARLQQDADNGNSRLQALTGKAEALLAQVDHASSYLNSEILQLPAQLQQTLLQDASLTEYHFYLQNLWRQAQHILPAEQEALLSQSQLATSTATSAFQALVSADLQFAPAQDAQQQAVPVSEGSYMLHLTSPDRHLRRTFFLNLMKGYAQFRNTLAATLTGSCRRANFYALAHNYPDTLSATLDEDNIPVAFYDQLLTTIQAHLQPLHEYIQLKKQVLALDSFHYYDMYLPLTTTGASFNYSYEEACQHICTALKPLGAEYLATLRKGLSSGWVDIYENAGKRSGAYSWSVYGVHPYVLLNYQPRYNSMSTLAHEMGHALHSYFSNAAQPYVNSDYSIFCAEIASTTNESLLLEHTLAQAEPRTKLYLLNQFLETVRTTVYRQLQFAEFERFIHEKITQGESLQAETLNQYWLESNARYYGPALTLDEELASEWSRIPHFYTPFYVYKYATGYAAATAFSEAIMEQRPQAVPKYLHFLHAGASDYPLALLQQAGVDFSTPVPLQLTLEKFRRKLAEFKELLHTCS